MQIEALAPGTDDACGVSIRASLLSRSIEARHCLLELSLIRKRDGVPMNTDIHGNHIPSGCVFHAALGLLIFIGWGMGIVAMKIPTARSMTGLFHHGAYCDRFCRCRWRLLT